MPARKKATCDFMREFLLSVAFRAAANDWSGALLFALGFAHELLKTREVGHLEVATLAAQQTDGGKPTQLARNRLAMCADAIGNIGKGWSRGQQSLPVLLARICSKTEQLGMDSILNH